MRAREFVPRRSSSGVCPGCESALVNGQGLYHCPECGWSGTSQGTAYFDLVPPERSAAESDEGV